MRQARGARPLAGDGFTRLALYISWSAFCVVFIALTVGTFWRAGSTELVRWLRATREPDGTW